MTKRIFYFLFLLILIACASGRKTTNLSFKEIQLNKQFDIYLLIGQSNMAGRAPERPMDLDTLKGVFLFTGNDSMPWEPAANPLNKFSTIRRELSAQKLGPGYYFAKKMADSDPLNPIGLVVNARGGTSIKLWLPGTDYYGEAVKQAKRAMKYGVLKGILWHQGESDVKDYKLYPEKITNLINSLRTDLGKPDLPFVAGELSEDKPSRIPFNGMIVELPSAIPQMAVVLSDGLTTFDSTHFDAASQEILGNRYAEKMITLQKKKHVSTRK